MSDLEFSENAQTVLKERYLQPGESIEDLFKRVARYIAQPEDDPEWEQKFFDAMMRQEFMPNSPTLFNAGTDKAGSLSACFVVGVEDSMESIMDAAKLSALIQKWGGGVGYNFSKLRAKGTPIQSTHGLAMGPVSVIKHMDSVAQMVTQGGKRAGAQMAELSVNHPDVEDFISMKDDLVTAQTFNISVAVDNFFMKSIVEGKEQEHALFDKIVTHAWQTGDPGLFFIDHANNHTHPFDIYRHPERMVFATNPCGEVPLEQNEACNLGHINLARCVDDQGNIDYLKLIYLTKLGVRFLDNVVTMNEFPHDAIRTAVDGNRKIGLGVMGFADMLYMMEIPYDSDVAILVARDVMNVIKSVALEESVKLGRERGNFPNWSQSKWAERNIPMRNATRTCIAPTGTTAIISDCSSGIEPHFSIKNTRKMGSGTILNELRNLDPEARHTRLANDINWRWHVKMQAVFQEYVDLAVSKTINLPHSATKEDIAGAYLLAWKLGCKGITVFRDGCRSDGKQVLEHIKDPAGIAELEQVFCCAEPDIIYSEGCETCQSCGASKCTV